MSRTAPVTISTDKERLLRVSYISTVAIMSRPRKTIPPMKKRSKERMAVDRSSVMRSTISSFASSIRFSIIVRRYSKFSPMSVNIFSSILIQQGNLNELRKRLLYTRLLLHFPNLLLFCWTY